MIALLLLASEVPQGISRLLGQILFIFKHALSSGAHNAEAPEK